MATKSISEQLKGERTRLKISQQKVAEKAGISFETVKNIERGHNVNPTLYVLRAISKALNYYKFDI
jgi:transcriptional regulator with XRE-family HTH domain